MSIIDTLEYISSDSDKLTAVVKWSRQHPLNPDDLVKILQKLSSDSSKVTLIKKIPAVIFKDSWLTYLRYIFFDSSKIEVCKIAAASDGIPFGDANDYDLQLRNLFKALNCISSDSSKIQAIKLWFAKIPSLMVTCEQLTSIMKSIGSDSSKVELIKISVSSILDKDDGYKLILNEIGSSSYKNVVCKLLNVEIPPESGSAVSIGGSVVISNVQFGESSRFGGSIVQTGKVKDALVQINTNCVIIDNRKYHDSLTWNHITFTFGKTSEGQSVCRVVDPNGIYVLAPGIYKIVQTRIYAQDGSKLQTEHEKELESVKQTLATFAGEVSEESVKKRKRDTTDSEPNAKSEEPLCVSCKEDVQSCLLLPCCHGKMCISCGHNAKKNNLCPVCNQPVKNAVEIL